jgi:hypothetical protein
MHRNRLPKLVLTTAVAFLAMAAVSAAKLDTANLWSTINICDTHKHPNKLGVRGRMPNDGHKSHTLWMKFIAQYKSGNKWKKVTSTKFELLGDGSRGWRSSGKTFTITFAKTAPKGTHFTFRGLVKYQWRSGSTVVLSKQRTTTSGHPAMDADPPGYSAATCVITK